MQALRDTAAPAADGIRRWAPIVIFIGLVAAFLVTRLPNLDADVPDWSLTQYSPIDEFAYTGPAFNLLHYGTWVHQAAPWAPVEGLPVNVVQNVAAATSMQLVGYDYWGLRTSSVLFGLIAFLALIAIVKRQADDARRFDGVPAKLAMAVTLTAVVLLLADFSSLLSARIIEPTVTRLAAAAVVVYLVSRGTFLGDRHGPLRSVVFGAVVGLAVVFVYIYNLFLLPAALVTLAWWAYRRGGRPALVRHSIAFIVGVAVVTTVYFVLVYLVYGQTPIEWYRVWIGSFGNSSRTTGLSLAKVLSILDANVFRLDPVFLGLFLVSLPVFAWSMARRPTGAAVLIGLGLVFFVAQSAFVADYPARKFLMVMLFALPIAAAGILGASGFRAWVRANRRRVVAASAWLVGALLVMALQTPLRPVPPHGATLALVVTLAAVAGIATIATLAVAARRRWDLLMSCVLAAAMLVPLLYADITFVYRHPTFTYRDAQIQVRDVVDGQVTAGGLSFGMQLYNTSRPTLSGYFFGISQAEYERDVVRMFVEGLASSMFTYVDTRTRSHWEGLGFRVVETYSILLPRGQVMGRYVFAPSG